MDQLLELLELGSLTRDGIPLDLAELEAEDEDVTVCTKGSAGVGADQGVSGAVAWVNRRLSVTQF